jgi:hypothetical protein
MSAIGDAIDECLAEPGVGDHLGPFGEGQVGGQDDGGFFGPFGHHLEQEFSAHFSQWHIADLIEGDKVITGPAREHAAELQLMFGFDQLVDQTGGGGEPHPSFLAAGGHRQTGEQVRFAGTTIADKDDRFGALYVATLSQFLDLQRRDLGVAREVELMLSST